MTEGLSKGQRWAQIKARFWSILGALLAFCFVFILSLFPIFQLISNKDLWAPLATLAAVLGAILVYVLSMKKKSRYAKCPSCSAPFSLTLIDRDEDLISAVPRQSTKLVSRSVNDDRENYQRDSWVDETYRVVDTVECGKCGEQFERKYTKREMSGKTSHRDW